MTGMTDDKLLSDYKGGMVIFKQLLEHVFGKDGRYTVDDGKFYGDKCRIELNGNVDGIASYDAVLPQSPLVDMHTLNVGDFGTQWILRLFFYYDLSNENLKVKGEDICKEVKEEKLDNFTINAETYNQTGPLSYDATNHAIYSAGVELIDSDDAFEYNVSIYDTPFFTHTQNLLFEIRRIDEGIKKIIKKHRT